MTIKKPPLVHVLENKKTGARRYVFVFGDIYMIVKTPREKTEEQYLSVKIMEEAKYHLVRPHWNTKDVMMEKPEETIKVMAGALKLVYRLTDNLIKTAQKGD